MNAIEDNLWSRGFKELGSRLPLPQAILTVSAHWYVHGTLVTANDHPPTIHDFGGFPEPLYEMQYPAPGSPALADRVVDLLGADMAATNLEWGLDHGTWSILHHMRPRADCPVVQLSIDGRLNATRHVEIGRALAPLRDEGVMILGSGNLVHNLGDAFGRMRSGDLTTPKWASDFDAAVARALEQGDRKALGGLIETPEAKKAHPTPEHFLPILYVAGASEGDAVSFPITGFDLGSISMRCVVFGDRTEGTARAAAL
jgi:4,5-DOPA dioxygenase extradiol